MDKGMTDQFKLILITGTGAQISLMGFPPARCFCVSPKNITHE